MPGRTWAPGYLSTSSGNIEVSQGGDHDIMSFYSTEASTAWTNKRFPDRYENMTEISTGYVKNFPHIQEPTRKDEDSYVSTYKAVNAGTMKRIRTSGKWRYDKSFKKLVSRKRCGYEDSDLLDKV